MRRVASQNHETPLMAEWRQNTQAVLDNVGEQIKEMTINIARMSSKLEDLVNERLSREAYQIAHKALEERVERLEAGPSNLVPWFALGCSGVSALLTMLTMAGGAVVWIVTHH